MDRTLQDICDNKQPFGGITVVLGGDFRQILPVIPKGVREQIVGASLWRSYIWNRIHVLTLTLNMRLGNSTDEFAKFLMEVIFYIDKCHALLMSLILNTLDLFTFLILRLGAIHKMW